MKKNSGEKKSQLCNFMLKISGVLPFSCGWKVETRKLQFGKQEET